MTVVDVVYRSDIRSYKLFIVLQQIIDLRTRKNWFVIQSKKNSKDNYPNKWSDFIFCSSCIGQANNTCIAPKILLLILIKRKLWKGKQKMFYLQSYVKNLNEILFIKFLHLVFPIIKYLASRETVREPYIFLQKI